MKITYYNSTEYRKTTTVEVDYIIGNMESDEISDADREALRSGDMKPMCNFAVNYAWMSVPWEFVIRIED